jgi:hypothetical protein
MSAYIKKSERFQINSLMMHLKPLEQQEQAKPNKSGRQKEIIKIRTEINKTETNFKTNETKSWFFKTIETIDNF